MQAIILAAGRGTRLHPITLNRTKAMCPIAGKPMVARVIDTLSALRIREFVIVYSPEDLEIRPYFQSLKNDLQIQFVPQNERLGMGHALLQATPHIHTDFILSSCDNLVAENEIVNMHQIWQDQQPNAILSALKVGPAEIVRMGILALADDQVTGIVEKPTLETAPSNIGSVPLYFFSKKICQYLPLIQPSQRGEYELQDAIQMLIEKDGNVRNYNLTGRIDLTTPADLLSLNARFMPVNQVKMGIAANRLGKNTRLVPPVVIGKNITIGAGCQIGPNVYLEDGCTVEDGVRLENTVVLRGRRVAAGTNLSGQIVY